MDFFATAAKGTEGALEEELRELGLDRVRRDRGGVHFGGPLEDGWCACLWSRIAVRVLARAGEIDAPDADSLYEGVRSLDFAAHVKPRSTIAVRATSRSSRLGHAGFVALRTKDAIVDGIRDATGSRPDVDADDPDVSVFVHLDRDRASVHLDLAGQPLHRRGWRKDATAAPLKETLAAALLRLSGWDRVRPLVDPMCGSGTIAIEAALWAMDVAPGIGRERFGFERWASHDEGSRARMRAMREEARERTRPEGPEIVGSDIDAHALARARANAERAGVNVLLRRADLGSLEPTEPPGFVVTNPPYGERLGGGRALYRELGRVIARLRGHRVCILSGTRAIERAIPIRPRRRHALWNGPIECKLLVYEG